MSLTQSKKWLIIRNGAAGDTLLLSPVLQAVHDQYQNAHIEVMGNIEQVELLLGYGLADKATAFDQPGIESLFVDQSELSNPIKEYFQKFDVIIYYGQNHLETIQSKLKVKDEQTVITHPALPNSDDVHITEHYLQAVVSLIDNKKSYIPKIALRVDEIEWGKTWLKEQSSHIDDCYGLGVHVGAGSKMKRAPIEYYLKKINEIESKQSPLLMIPKGPADDDAVDAFIGSLPKDISYVVLEELRLRELAAVLSCCDEFIGNDSGVTHIAAALGIPTTAVFVTGNPVMWKPLGECVRVVDLIS